MFYGFNRRINLMETHQPNSTQPLIKSEESGDDETPKEQSPKKHKIEKEPPKTQGDSMQISSTKEAGHNKQT